MDTAFRAFAVLAATASLLGSTVAVAGAQPEPTACTYELTAPRVVNVPGTGMVTAT